MINNQVTDWKGNIIKEGDEICTVIVKTGGEFKNLSVIFPDGKGGIEKEIKFPDEPEEECWKVGEYVKVENINGKLMYTTKIGKYTVTQPISMIEFFMSNRCVIAIKGLSDTKG